MNFLCGKEKERKGKSFPQEKLMLESRRNSIRSIWVILQFISFIFHNFKNREKMDVEKLVEAWILWHWMLQTKFVYLPENHMVNSHHYTLPWGKAFSGGWLPGKGNQRLHTHSFSVFPLLHFVSSVSTSISPPTSLFPLFCLHLTMRAASFKRVDPSQTVDLSTITVI